MWQCKFLTPLFQVFLGILYSNLLCKALEQEGAHLHQAKHFNLQFFSPIILLFAQQNKYSFFSVIKPFQVCCCVTSGAERAWKSLFLWKLFTDPIRNFHWKQQNPVEGIFFSAMTELNECGNWKMWTPAPAPQSTPTAFSKFRHHKEREKLQASFPGVFPKFHWHSC